MISKMMLLLKVHFIFFLFYIFYQPVNGDECSAGFFGFYCNQVCGHCMGGHSFCNKVNGSCGQGCEAGFIGETCEDYCPPGTYGLLCSEVCPGTCLNKLCDAVDGNCAETGCVAGYMGRFCSEPCPGKKWGQKCAKECDCENNCSCDPVTGTCLDTGCDAPKPKKTKRNAEYKEAVKEDSNTLWDPDPPNKEGSSDLMCSDMENTFYRLKKTLNKRVEVPLWPMLYLMLITAAVVIIVGVVNMVTDLRREMYVRRWERENILTPLEMRAREIDDELGDEKGKSQAGEKEDGLCGACSVS